MKLLIVTQKVNKNDDVLGFFHEWIKGFAAVCSQVTVICLEVGPYELPNNVKVLSLGKEQNVSRFKYIARFYKYIWQERKNYDAVFVHMNQIYVILGGLVWRLLHKKISFWYVHRQVTNSLKIATKLTDWIFSSAPESFLIKTPKVQFVGHGIDTEKFNKQSLSINPNKIVISQIGRITQIKNCNITIDALKELQKGVSNQVELRFIGKPMTQVDEKYFEGLQSQVAQLNLQKNVVFSGSVAHRELAHVYKEASITVNATPTGGMDKVVLESLAAARPAFTCNKIFSSVLSPYEKYFIFEENNSQDLAVKIQQFLALSSDIQKSIIEVLSKKVTDNFSIKSIVTKITSRLQ